MTESELLYDAIRQIPGLVEAAKTYRAGYEKAISTLASAVKQQPLARIPEYELEKVGKMVSRTRCALPDVKEIDNLIATRVMNLLRPELHEEIEFVVSSTEVKLKHEHSYHLPKDLKKFVDEKTTRIIRALGILGIVLSLALVFTVLSLRRSELRLGESYLQMYNSEWVTKDERELMADGIEVLSIYPNKYKDKKKLLREKLRYNREIIKQRRAYAKDHDGDYLIEPKVEF